MDQVYRVILAEDTPDFLAWLAAALKRSKDFTLLGEAVDGCEALRLIEIYRPDVVLADVEMPCLDGLELAQAVRRNRPEIKMILFSSHAEPGYERLARAEGAIAFMPKSRLSVEALANALSAAA